MGHRCLIESCDAKLHGRVRGACVSEHVAHSMKNQKKKCPEEPHLEGQTWVLQCERGDTDECRSMCAQQGDSSWPKQQSLITHGLLLTCLLHWRIIPDFFPWRFFFVCAGSSSRPFKKETPGASWWFHCGPELLSWGSHCRWGWGAQATHRYPGPGLAESKSFESNIIQHSMRRGGSDAALLSILLLLSKKLYLTFPGQTLGGLSLACSLLSPRTHFSQNWAHSRTSMGRDASRHVCSGGHYRALGAPLTSQGGEAGGWMGTGGRMKPAVRGSRLVGAEERCLERESFRDVVACGI